MKTTTKTIEELLRSRNGDERYWVVQRAYHHAPERRPTGPIAQQMALGPSSPYPDDVYGWLRVARYIRDRELIALLDDARPIVAEHAAYTLGGRACLAAEAPLRRTLRSAEGEPAREFVVKGCVAALKQIDAVHNAGYLTLRDRATDDPGCVTVDDLRHLEGSGDRDGAFDILLDLLVVWARRDPDLPAPERAVLGLSDRAMGELIESLATPGDVVVVRRATQGCRTPEWDPASCPHRGPYDGQALVPAAIGALLNKPGAPGREAGQALISRLDEGAALAPAMRAHLRSRDHTATKQLLDQFGTLPGAYFAQSGQLELARLVLPDLGRLLLDNDVWHHARHYALQSMGYLLQAHWIPYVTAQLRHRSGRFDGFAAGYWPYDWEHGWTSKRVFEEPTPARDLLEALTRPDRCVGAMRLMAVLHLSVSGLVSIKWPAIYDELHARARSCPAPDLDGSSQLLLMGHVPEALQSARPAYQPPAPGPTAPWYRRLLWWK